MFAYCLNNPISLRDNNGESPSIATLILCGAIFGALSGAFIAACTDGDILWSMLEGAATGATSVLYALFGASVWEGILGAVAAGMYIDIMAQTLEQGFSESPSEEIVYDYDRIAKTGVAAGVSAAIPGIGNYGDDIIDAFGTALFWGESSMVIAAVDIMGTHAISWHPNKIVNQVDNHHSTTIGSCIGGGGHISNVCIRE